MFDEKSQIRIGWAVAIAIVLLAIGAAYFLFMWGSSFSPGPNGALQAIRTGLMEVLMAGGGVLVCSITLNVIYSNTPKIEKDPYKWIMPVMAILAAFTIDIIKDAIVKAGKAHHLPEWAETTLSAAIAGVTALIYLLGGILWRKKSGRKWLHRLSAILLFIAPLLIASLWLVIGPGTDRQFDPAALLNWQVLLPAGVFLLFFGITVIVSFAYQDEG